MRSLGFGLSTEPIPNTPYAFPLDNDGNWIDAGDMNEVMTKGVLNRTAGQSALQPAGYAGGHGNSYKKRTPQPHKRQRSDSPVLSRKKQDLPLNHNQMPPPRKSTGKKTSFAESELGTELSPSPVSRMRSMRKKFPSSLRKAFTGRNFGRNISHSAVDSYNSGYWEERPGTSSGQDQQIVSHASGQEEPSAAEDVKRLSAFTFRSEGPAQTYNAPSHAVPHQPSYICLLDSLGSDKGLDFRIQDPRQRPADGHRSTHTDLQASQLNPKGHESQMDQASIAVGGRVGRARSNALYGGNVNPLTSAPGRHKEPANETNDIVSPFFEANFGQTPTISRANNAERHRRPAHSGAYQSRGSLSQMARGEWREPPSLNGLSFFNEPVNGRHETIDRKRGSKSFGYVATPQKPQYQACNLDSQGFVMRPETYRSPEGPLYSRQQAFSHSHASTPFQPFTHPPQQPTFTRLPLNSANRSPVRLSTRRNDMGLFYVKSSNNSLSHSLRNAPSPSTVFPSVTGRRSIRR